MNAPSPDTLLAVCLLLVMSVVVPAFGVWDYRRFLRKLREGRANARTEAYRWTLVMQWTLTAVFLGWWFLSGEGIAPLRLAPAAAGWQWLAVAAGLAALAAIALQAVTVLRSPEKLKEVREQAGDLSELAPTTPAESRLFAMVSLTAGICEEILYRGLLLAVLAPAVGTWPAVALSTAIFGLGHAYQGVKGVGKTAAVGLVLALLAVGTGSLYLPMLLHAVVDLTSGRMLAKASRTSALGHGA